MTGDVQLRDVIEDDLPQFYEHQLDPEANHMAAFVARDRDPFMTHWTKVLADETISKKTILFHGQVAGNIVCFEQFGERLVGYWISREYWGKGIGTKALSEFLDVIQVRPLHARVAIHNSASIRVLEKCGFTIIGEDSGYSSGLDEEVEEFILVLRANEGDLGADQSLNSC